MFGLRGVSDGHAGTAVHDEQLTRLLTRFESKRVHPSPSES